MTPDRTYSIQRFGCTEEEARFLRVDALQRGYFVRRQFIRSANCDFGKWAQV